MVALLNEDQRQFYDVDSDRFTSALTMSSEEDELPEVADFSSLCLGDTFLAVSASNESTTLRLLNANKNSPRLSATGILALVNHCEGIRELSLDYALLSDELVRAIANQAPHLTTLRVEAHPEAKPLPSITCEAWCALADRSPRLNLVLVAHMTEAKDYETLIAPHIPLTHLCFGEGAPSSAVARVGERCPRLTELVVGAFGPGTIDEALIAAARGCPRLSALGLGDCELTCSSLVEFVSLCCERLQILYILDTSLIEDSKYDITEAADKVSLLLRKSWEPNYVPYW